jgi:hypothetical protein
MTTILELVSWLPYLVVLTCYICPGRCLARRPLAQFTNAPSNLRALQLVSK